MPRRAGAEGPWREDEQEVARKRVGAKQRAEPFLGLGLGLLQTLGLRLEDQNLGGRSGSHWALVCQAEWIWLLLLGACGAWSSRSVERKEIGSQGRRRSEAQAQETVSGKREVVCGS